MADRNQNPQTESKEPRRAPESGDEAMNPGMSRRQALLATTSVAAGAVLAACGPGDNVPDGGAVTCTDLSPQTIPAPGAETLAVNQAKTYIAMGGSPAVFVVRDSKGLFAMQPVCTHSGCDPTFNAAAATFDCRCHGSRFNIDGTVKMGPAARPLLHLDLCRRADGVLVVDPYGFLKGIDKRLT